MIKISFIIPAYNVEEYIEQCINSIISQFTCGYEIILVDDGSTDNTTVMCDILAKKHSAVKVIHKENGGHSSARNCGLNTAIGKYVAFIDSDDFIELHSLKHIIEWVENNDEDVCILNSYKYFSDGSTKLIDVMPKREKVKGTTPDKALDLITSGEKFPGSACGKLFKRSFLKANNLEFPENILHGEDLRFMVKVFAFAKSFDILDIDFYYYRQGREGSVTTNVDKQKMFDDISGFVVDTIEIGKKIPNKQFSMQRIAAYEYLILIYVYNSLSKEDKKKAIEFLKRYKWLLSCSNSKRAVMVKTFSLLLGFSITSFALNLWMNIR